VDELLVPLDDVVADHVVLVLVCLRLESVLLHLLLDPLLLLGLVLVLLLVELLKVLVIRLSGSLAGLAVSIDLLTIR
jgi:hypothetical protein